MKHNNHLHQLIKSLNKSEKRHYKIVANLYSTKNEHSQLVQLFDAINAQEEEYNEDKILRKFKDELFAQHLPSLKAKLEEQILESLESTTPANISIEMQIRRWLNQCEIFLTKGLIQQAQIRLQKAKQKAEKYEHIKLLLHTLAIELRITASNEFEKQRELAQRIQSLSLLLSSFIDYFLDAQEVAKCVHQWGQGAEYKALLATLIPLERYQNPPTQMLFHTQRYIINLHINYNISIQNIAVAAKYSEQLITLWDEYKWFKKLNPSSYIGNCISYANLLSTHLANFEESNRYLSCAEELLNQQNSKLDWYERRQYNIWGQQQSNYFYLQKWQNFNDLLAKFTAYRGQESEPFKSLFLSFCFDSTLQLYALNRHNEAVDWLQYIINQREKGILLRANVIESSYVLLFIIYFEQKQFELLEHTFQAAYRFFYKNGHVQHIEGLILSFMRKIIKEFYYIKLYSYYQELWKKTELFDDTQDSYVFFKIWLKSKINKQSFLSLYLAIKQQ